MGGLVDRCLRSQEMLLDSKYTDHIGNISQVKTGDIIGVRYVNRFDSKLVHVGIALVQNDVVNFVHNARHVKHTVIQPLDEAQKFAGHEVLAWIKRVKKFDPNSANVSFLNQHGLQELLTTNGGH